MKIDSVKSLNFCVPKIRNSAEEISVGSQRKCSRANVSFGNAPWVLDPADYGISRHGSLSGKEAITLYSQLRKGNYLDIGNDTFDFSYCNRIRESNLSFLDRLTYSSDKMHFIAHYSSLTGFPNLQAVSNQIENTFKSALVQSMRDLSGSQYEVLLAGYDGVCSVGRGKAFPGSDLDKAYVILRGKGDLTDINNIVNKFKGKLWDNTDQRILSYNHDAAAFPQVYTYDQIEMLTSAVDSKTSLYSNNDLSRAFHRQVDLMYDQFGENNAVYKQDYVEANPYWIESCKKFLRKGDDSFTSVLPSRENIKNVGFTLEAIREGKVLRGFHDNIRNVFHYNAYRLANLSQLSALKKLSDRKPKRVARDNIIQEFSLWDLDKQFRFIKTLIQSACANNREFTTEFGKYFSKPGQDMFAPLIKALMG